MPNVTAPALSIPAKSFPGASAGAPSGVLGELVLSELAGKYSTLAKAGKIFSALAIVTAPVIWSTAAGSGGPLLWNKPGSGVEAHLLAMTVSNQTTAGATVAGALGIAQSLGQVAAPTTTTAIDASGNLYAGGGVSQMGGIFRIGTVANAASNFVPIVSISDGAITTVTSTQSFVDLGGMFVVSPGTCGFVAATATLTSDVVQIGLVWAELPV